MSNELMFGASIHPGRDLLPGSLDQAKQADGLGFDIITVMDHPYNVDTFNFWPGGGDVAGQFELFAGEVAPAVRAAVAPART